MIGKEAYEFIVKNKDIIDDVTIVDIENGQLKCFYEVSIEKILKQPYRFKSDLDNSWDVWSEDNAYLKLYEIKFKSTEEQIDIVKMTRGYALRVNAINEDGTFN